MKLNLYNII